MSKQRNTSKASPNRAQGHGRKKKKQPEKMESQLPVLRPDAAGIDIGTDELWVSVPEDRDQRPVRVFATFTNAVKAMITWLQQCRIQTVAMESTGVLWIPVYQMIEEAGIEVCLVNARHYQNVPGKRTDVQDCQWLRFLHSVGLLKSSFRPEQAVCAIRTLVRQREQLVQMRSQHIQHMHKALDQMNLKLQYVISDIVGASGQRIVRSILDGERNVELLAKLRDRKIQASEEQIRESLVGDYREEHLFTLRQSFELWEEYNRRVDAVEVEIEKYTARLETKLELKGMERAAGGPKRGRKCKPQTRHLATMRDLCRQKYGVDICRITGMKRGGVAEVLIAEVGTDLSQFSSASAFAAWLGVCPNHEISGGKILSRKTKKIKQSAAVAFRMAAQSLERGDEYLNRWYRTMKGRLGAPKAITAAAHKLARIFYYMVTRQVEFDEGVFAQHEQRMRDRAKKNLEKRAAQMGYKLVAA
jgi:transposase